MANLLSCRNLTKSHAARPLFSGLTFGIDDNERAGLIGPNGSGKSTLLKILAGFEKPDGGELSIRRGLKIGYVAQEEEFPAGATVESVLHDALKNEHAEEDEKAVRVEIALATGGFEDRARECDNLSGGWRKRLAIVAALLPEPELLLMDEPTNHLDLAGVEWLEGLLERPGFGVFVITHDRYFLENVTRRIIELNPGYAEGCFSAEGGYTDFLEKRAAYFASQAHQQVALASEVRREIAWLRRGAKARTTKAKGRIEDAGEKIEALAELNRRNNLPTALEGAFTASGRRTKELVALHGVTKALGGRTLFENIDVLLTPGLKLGLVGPNGSGKTTLLRLISGDLAPDSGKIVRADGLRTVWFDQSRTGVDKNLTLREALSPNSDLVRYRDSTMHVVGWAKKFLFREEQLGSSVGRLSGGEQARVALARLMLQPADLLILDEPTNDLDLASLAVLEDALETFPGALVLVSHDRYLLDTVCNQVLALEGSGAPGIFADYAQWDARRKERTSEPQKVRASGPSFPKPAPVRNVLSASERKELEKIEETIHAAEEKVAAVEAKMAEPEVATNGVHLAKMWAEDLPQAKAKVERLYARWEELEAKKAGA